MKIECKSVGVERNVDLPLASSARYPGTPHLESGSWRVAAWSCYVEFQLFSMSQYVTRRLCIKKIPGRTGHESNRIFVSFFDYICSAGKRAGRAYTPTTETHVCPCTGRLPFRGTEFIFPEEIRKGILPVSGTLPRPPVLLLNCQPRASP